MLSEETLKDLLPKVGIMIETHNESSKHTLPADINDFKQTHVTWCAQHKQSILAEIAVYVNPNLVMPTSKRANPNPLARTFTRNDVNLTQDELEKAYIEHFQEDISFNKIAKKLCVHPATLGRLLNRMYIQRNTNLRSIYEKDEENDQI